MPFLMMEGTENISMTSASNFDLHGKRALITGASRGIGRAIARALSGAGVHVALNYRERNRDAEMLRGEIERSGGTAITVQADLAQADHITTMMQEIRANLGEIDILVNNAGVSRPIPVDQLTEADWDSTLNTNLKSAFLTTQNCLPHMRAQGWGRLIFISSVAAQVGGVVGPHYAASKAGMHGMMHYYAAHLAKEGISANAVAPALIRTEMVTRNPNARPDLIPVGHFGESEDVAAVVVMLAGNSYITGQTINVNGGWYPS